MIETETEGRDNNAERREYRKWRGWVTETEIDGGNNTRDD